MTVADTHPTEQIRLDLEGMTCASCASRIERSLNELDGVEATVNLATDQAAVRFDPSVVSVADLVGTVEAAGYAAAPESEHAHAGDESGALRLRLVVAAVLSVPVALLAMVMPLQFAGWEWVAFALSTPVVLWAGWPFHRVAFQAARHRRGDDGHADLDRDARRLGLVDGRAARRARRRHVLRGCRRDHDADPARALPRVTRPASLG